MKEQLGITVVVKKVFKQSFIMSSKSTISLFPSASSFAAAVHRCVRAFWQAARPPLCCPSFERFCWLSSCARRYLSLEGRSLALLLESRSDGRFERIDQWNDGGVESLVYVERVALVA